MLFFYFKRNTRLDEKRIEFLFLSYVFVKYVLLRVHKIMNQK